MGKHTAYWQEYQKVQVRGALRIVLTVAAWILVIVFLVALQDLLAAAFPFLIAGAFLGLVVCVLVQSRGVYDVTCPECSTPYQRNKWGGTCPSCGLKLLQHDP